MHISRYIHLNPYSGGVVYDLKGLSRYAWSSFPAYSGKETNNDFVDRDIIMNLFKYNKEEYRKYIFDQADYQKTLEKVKYADRW